ncbi:MAG: alcohol dehydrogenase catalytic domain-containing protein [Planctomycetes bacterium]|nr:alcohol dehydrogenase catalytic domain-containing protein [Planctomycetota bacterium]
MRASICTEPGKIEMQEIEKPKPEGNQVLVEVKACAICKSDVTGYHGKHPLMECPIILGHECSGIVAEVGPHVTRVKPGQRVAVETFFYVCGECAGCRTGAYNVCKNVQIIGHNAPGAFAEYVLANGDFVFQVPDNVPFEHAALTEPTSVGVHTIKRCGVQVGDFVVVLGLGCIGLFVLQVAKLAGAEVLVADLQPFKLEMARKFGADHIVDASKQDTVEEVMKATNDDGADVVIDAAGAPATLKQMVDCARSGATLMPIGFTGKDYDEINMGRITLGEMTLYGILGFCRDFPTSLRLMGRGQIDTASMITHHFSLDEVEKGIQTMTDPKSNMIRGIVVP